MAEGTCIRYMGPAAGRSGPNSRPLDLQSDALPTALRGPAYTNHCETLCALSQRLSFTWISINVCVNN